MRSLTHATILRVVLGCTLLLWTSTPVAAASEDPVPSCLRTLEPHVAPGTELSVVRTDGSVVKGRLRRLDVGDSLLRLTVYEPTVSRFSSVDFVERDIASLTYRQSTTDKGLAFMFVTGMVALGGFMGMKLGGLQDSSTDVEEFTPSEVGLGILGGLAGLVGGLVLAPRSSKEVTLKCASAAP